MFFCGSSLWTQFWKAATSTYGQKVNFGAVFVARRRPKSAPVAPFPTRMLLGRGKKCRLKKMQKMNAKKAPYPEGTRPQSSPKPPPNLAALAVRTSRLPPAASGKASIRTGGGLGGALSREARHPLSSNISAPGPKAPEACLVLVVGLSACSSLNSSLHSPLRTHSLHALLCTLLCTLLC